ncbi:MAG: hypothetical protein ACOX04_00340 [Candidatus Scatomorpha sp.]|jgi:hypothetical protein
MEKKVFFWEPWFFMAFGIFHLHRIWGLIDRNSYAEFWVGLLNNKGALYFLLMGVLSALCILGIFTFLKNLRSNYWWRWIYLFGGAYLLFDLAAIAIGLEFWNKLLLRMFDVGSAYWNLIWSFFILLGGFAFFLGAELLVQRKRKL